MTSPHEDLMSAYNATDFASFSEADTVTYTPSGGSGSSVSAILTRDPVVIEEVADGKDELHRASLFVQVSEVATITPKDKINFDGADWAVDTWHLVGAGVWEIQARRKVEFRKARPGSYRD